LKGRSVSAAESSINGRPGIESQCWRRSGSGAKTDRSQLRRVLDRLAAGDVLMVTRGRDRLPYVVGYRTVDLKLFDFALRMNS
jgi:hypothetical protein